MDEYILESLQDAMTALSNLLKDQGTLNSIAEAGKLLGETFEQGGSVFSCGNGGSMCDAMHFAEELSGRYRLNRQGLPAVAISDAGYISCVSNDFGYEHIFSRYLEAHARRGDCLLAISTSGSSKNVVVAAQAVKEREVRVIALTGRKNSQLSQLADVEICTIGGKYADRVQELHIKVIHILIELVERRLFPENYWQKRA
jgi:D-sedoheptulose 7-phosphate isomerase